MRVLLAFFAGLCIGGLALAAVRVEAQPSPQFTQFTGSWGFHQGIVQIDGNGHGYEFYRTYTPCTATVVTACDMDTTTGSFNGGYDRFYLAKVQGNTAIGYVTASAYSWEVGTQVTFTRRPGSHTMQTRYVTHSRLLCNAMAQASGACGA